MAGPQLTEQGRLPGHDPAPAGLLAGDVLLPARAGRRGLASSTRSDQRVRWSPSRARGSHTTRTGITWASSPRRSRASRRPSAATSSSAGVAASGPSPRSHSASRRRSVSVASTASASRGADGVGRGVAKTVGCSGNWRPSLCAELMHDEARQPQRRRRVQTGAQACPVAASARVTSSGWTATGLLSPWSSCRVCSSSSTRPSRRSAVASHWACSAASAPADSRIC